MIESKPFLFLDSPRVGRMMGHAWVITPDERTHSEEEFRSLGSEARKSQAHHANIIAVQHTVLQTDTKRWGPELLICAGAIPESSADIKAIREVLETLWKAEVTEADLYQDKLIERSAFIYAAPCMKRIADGFYAHDMVKDVRWKTVKWKPDEQAPLPKPPVGSIIERIWKRIKRLPLLMKLLITVSLVIIGGIAIGKADKKIVPAGKESVKPAKTYGLEKWKFLADDDWQRLMHATGGGEIAVRLKDEVNETRASRKEHKKPIIDFKKYFDGKESTGVSRSQDESDKIESIASEIDKWSKRFSAEFSLGDEPTPATLQSAQIPKFLRDAKSTNDKKNIAAWFRPTLNQRDPYSPELRDQAIALEAFQKIVGDLPPEDLPKRLRDISQALYTFSKSTTQTTQDQEDSRKFIADEFKKSTPPPDDYETLTVKDAERLELIQNILDRLKYGFVVPDQPKAENKRSKWTTINNHIARGIDLTKESKIMDPEIVLLRALEKSFGSSQKK